MAQWQIIFFQTPCPQTLSQLMFNKFKQDYKFKQDCFADTFLLWPSCEHQIPIIMPGIFKMYFKYKMQNTKMYFKYVFQIIVFEILRSIDRCHLSGVQRQRQSVAQRGAGTGSAPSKSATVHDR